ncbi:MAG: hypothetical protein LIP01_00975 [Tannerellaceae bacterium]|nr:hypothetical protein [Tannerellaceae bacterium]
MAEMQEIKRSYWIDTTDITSALEGYYIRKKIDLLRFRVSVGLPQTYAVFKEDMGLQWNYGYQRAMKMIEDYKHGKLSGAI